MGKLLDIDSLKCYIGKTFGKLTVLDVYRNNKKVIFNCECVCGNIIETYYRNVITLHTKSCGYIHSKEHRQHLSDLYTSNPERIVNISNKRRQWCKEHQDEVAAAAEKHSQWCSLHQDEVKARAEKYSQWCKDNPEKVAEKAEKYLNWFYSHPEKAKYITDKVSKWAIENPDKVKERSEKYSQWCKLHREEMAKISTAHSDWMRNNIGSIIDKATTTKQLHRSLSDFTALLEIIHPKYIDDLLIGNIKSKDIIETKCPICSKYAQHSLHNVFKFKDSKFKRNIPMCSECLCKLTSSSCEKEISKYISSIYSETPINNSRNIISQYELDLYYPEKKIAIEFNGDYFHNEDHKHKDYHYNKYCLCRTHNIILVSIFETQWLENREEIESYLSDLFNNIENKLSYKDNMMNNNYPSPKYFNCIGDYIEDYYTCRNRKVFTCGYTIIK